MSACLKMKLVVTKILEARSQMDRFKSGEIHLTIFNEPYLRLSIERHDNKVTVTHYIEINGDLVSDPDMEFVIGADDNWYPVAIQYADGSYYRARFSKNGADFVNLKNAEGLKRFSDLWAKNIRDQGFITAGL